MLWPSCEQGGIVEAAVIADDTFLFVCQECESSCLSYEDICVKAFIDYGGIWKV